MVSWRLRPGVAARVGPDTELGSAWPTWHSEAVLSAARAGLPSVEKRGKTVCKLL